MADNRKFSPQGNNIRNNNTRKPINSNHAGNPYDEERYVITGAAQRERQERMKKRQLQQQKQAEKEEKERLKRIQKKKAEEDKKKKKRKRVRKIKRFIVNAIIVVRNIIIVLSILAAIGGIGYLIYDKVFTVKQVTYSGNNWVSDESMDEYLFKGKKKVNLINLFFEDKFKDKASIPYVETYNLKFKWPNKLEVKVYEKDVIGCIKKDDLYYYMDKDGILLDVKPERSPDTMIIMGVAATQFEVNSNMGVDEAVVKNIFEIKKQLDKYNIEFEEVTYNYKSEFILKKGSLKVQLGEGEYIVEKIFELSQVYNELPQKGVLHLENCNGQKKNLYLTSD